MSFELIPAIDLKDSECVRLKQGRMEDATVYGSNPAEMAQRWFDQGAQRLHLVDLNGAFAGKPVNDDAIRSICKISGDIPVQIGGGIRNSDTIAAYLDAGITYCIIGSQAVREPEFVRQACREFPGHIIVGLDARDGKVAVDGWADTAEVLAVDLAKEFADAGVSSIVYTDISRDGMLSGCNVEATAELAAACGIPVIASGGIKDISDIEQLLAVRQQGVAGSILGRSIYEGTLDLQQAAALVKQELAQ
jgi:phosphoribosylformimino-5-aminoimidazole carboxamide ribotide isomerase